MKKFMVETTVTIKDGNYWIDSNIIKKQKIGAENIKELLEKYVEIAKKEYIEITPTAIKNKNAMYRDIKNESVQIGYVIIGHTEIQKDDYSWVKKTVELWVEISEIIDINFE